MYFTRKVTFFWKRRSRGAAQPPARESNLVAGRASGISRVDGLAGAPVGNHPFAKEQCRTSPSPLAGQGHCRITASEVWLAPALIYLPKDQRRDRIWFLLVLIGPARQHNTL